MTFITVGTNHKYSPIEIRERISFSKPRLPQALQFLKQANVLKGAVIVSTCNRTEVYATVKSYDAGKRCIEDFISMYHEIGKSVFLPYLYNYEGKDAIRQLLLVGCGIDSLILGETQVIGQLKQAFLKSQEADFNDEILTKMFHNAFSAAYRIRAETKISEGKISVGSVAIAFMKERFSTLSGKNILIIGMGKVTELVLKYLKAEKPNVVFLSSRTYEKAKNFARRIDAKAVHFDELKYYLNNADIVITATASPHFIIKKEMLEKTFSRKLLILDLALPRDVDPDVNKLKNIELFHLEDLDSIIKKNIQQKTSQAQKAKAIIDIEAERIWGKLIELEPEPALLP